MKYKQAAKKSSKKEEDSDRNPSDIISVDDDKRGSQDSYDIESDSQHIRIKRLASK